MEVEPKRNEADHNEQKPYVESCQAQHNPERAEAERLPNVSSIGVVSFHSRWPGLCVEILSIGSGVDGWRVRWTCCASALLYSTSTLHLSPAFPSLRHRSLLTTRERHRKSHFMAFIERRTNVASASDRLGL